MDDKSGAVVRIIQSLAEVSPKDWDACAIPPGEPVNPFLRHAFLNALEESGSATRRTGWLPLHLLLEDEAGALVGAVPMYLKNHSRGEYVFDHGWADAFERAGGNYYPKLQISVPFTPATGPRLLTVPGEKRGETEDTLLAAVLEVAKRQDASSAHFTFLNERQWNILGVHGLLQRTDQQFHWQNNGYGSFEDFLGALSSRKRKNIRKEREQALAGGVEIEWVTGADINENHWDAFFSFYIDTGNRKWGTPYLTRTFFSLIGERMPEDILLIMARRNGKYIAGALNFIGSDTLYGRNWGAIEHHPFLHFECCYYQAMDFAIARGLACVEAGAQGEHKLARGYLPVRTYSAHWIANPSFRSAVEHYLERERQYVEEGIAVLGEHSPFRHSADLKAETEDE